MQDYLTLLPMEDLLGPQAFASVRCQGTGDVERGRDKGGSACPHGVSIMTPVILNSVL